MHAKQSFTFALSPAELGFEGASQESAVLITSPAGNYFRAEGYVIRHGSRGAQCREKHGSGPGYPTNELHK